ncbi:hypothetical protein [Natronorubrum daqingense]|uniref:Uncharacterized protein n=1 Tax=Natronorubrum daqingense TaxID=588898 RepID=A0A1N7G680_9EURY|nr:hypothetical protein [Natronorubrum daqingense]APX98701.1 hypothetical protein BB347_18515 [Natronorubrum daqingense]SIS08014.1 hypothetical protein SAMN05421809_3758 [Natronorubrum daqingense]
MALERAREWAGQKLRPKQYVDEENAKTPYETQDPHTWRDEAAPSFRDKLAQRKYRILSKSFVLLCLLGVGIAGMRSFFPGIYYSEAVRTLVAVVTIVVVTGLLTINWMLKRLEHFDWLILNLPGGVEVYLGEYTTTNGGEEPIFKPLRGFTLWGTVGNHYELGDLSDDFARSFAKKDRKADDPVRMGLPKEADEQSVSTWYGTVLSVVSDGVEPDATSPEVDVRVWPSARDHDDTIDGLMDLVRTKERRIDDLQKEVSDLRESRNKYRHEANKTRQEVRDELVDSQKEIFESINPSVSMAAGQASQNQHTQTRSNGTTDPDPVMQDTMEAMSNE